MNEWTMTQSATGLDISDDESQISPTRKQVTSDRGKENIDPTEIALPPVTRAQAAAAATAAAMMTASQEDKMEKDRVALGDLDPKEYYAEGLDATSVILVHDEDEEAETDVEDHDHNPEVARADAKDEFTFQAPARSTTTETFLNNLETPSLAEILSSSTPHLSQTVSTLATSISDTNDFPIATDHEDQTMTSIDIWESESAKDENEGSESPRSVTVDGDSGFALQEL
jgi:hypothetical protein